MPRDTAPGDSSSRVPLNATSVITAVKGSGENSTSPEPFIANVIEGF